MDVQNKLQNLALLSLYILCAPFILAGTVAFAAYRSLIGVFLYVKHGEDFLGFLEGADAIWATGEDVHRNLINGAMILQGVDDPKQVKDNIKATIEQKCFKGQFPKMTSIKKQQFGYNFLLNNRIDLEEHVQLISVEEDEEINEDFLQRFLSKNANKPMPKEDAGLWEFLILDKPIQWNGKEQSNVFIMSRCHHCLSDGFSLLKFIFEHMLEDTTEKKFTEEVMKDRRVFLGNRILKIVQDFLRNMFILLVGPVIIIFNLTKSQSRNADPLIGRKLSGEKIVAWAVESDKKLVDYVKSIKNEVPDTRFSDVVLTAISASMNAYYEKKFLTVPKYMTDVVPMLDTSQIHFRPAELFNDFLVGVGDLPISLEHGKSSWTDRLDGVKIQTATFKKSNYILIHYLFTKLLSSLYPVWIQGQIMKKSFGGVIISILPGMNNKICTFNGILNDLFFWVPDPGNAGVGFSVLTYDGRFQIGLIVDKAVISDHEEARTLVNDVFKHIINFYDNK